MSPLMSITSQEIHEPSALVSEWICQEGQKLLTCLELQGLPSFSFQTACGAMTMQKQMNQARFNKNKFVLGSALLQFN